MFQELAAALESETNQNLARSFDASLKRLNNGSALAVLALLIVKVHAETQWPGDLKSMVEFILGLSETLRFEPAN